MRFTQRVVGQTVVVSLVGQMAFKTRRIYHQALQEAREKSPRRIVVNLEGVTYIDSAGLGLIALAHQQLNLENIHFGIAGARGPVTRILELAQLHKMMLVYETEEEALRLRAPVPALFA